MLEIPLRCSREQSQILQWRPVCPSPKSAPAPQSRSERAGQQVISTSTIRTIHHSVSISCAGSVPADGKTCCSTGNKVIEYGLLPRKCVPRRIADVLRSITPELLSDRIRTTIYFVYNENETSEDVSCHYDLI